MRLLTFLLLALIFNLDPHYRCGTISPLQTAPRLQPGRFYFVPPASSRLFLFPSDKIPNLKSKGDFYVLSQSQGPRVLVSVHVRGWPPLPHPAHRQPRLFLLRRLPLRLRSQHRPGPPPPRRSPR